MLPVKLVAEKVEAVVVICDAALSGQRTSPNMDGSPNDSLPASLVKTEWHVPPRNLGNIVGSKAQVFLLHTFT
jgi:hypothetical protein